MSDHKINGGLTNRVPNVNARGLDALADDKPARPHTQQGAAHPSKPTTPNRPDGPDRSQNPNRPDKSVYAKDGGKVRPQGRNDSVRGGRPRELEAEGSHAFHGLSRGPKNETDKTSWRAGASQGAGRGRSPHTAGKEEAHDNSGAGRTLMRQLRNEERPSRDTPPGLADVLSGVRRAVGRDALRGVEPPRAERLERLFDRLLGSAGRPLEQARHWQSPKKAAQGAVRELASAVQLVRHFDQLKKVGGEVVTRAEARALNFLGRQAAGREGASPRVNPSELLRDLRSGAFLPARDVRNPFPATGRARVVIEMAELMRTLDAIEGAAGEHDGPVPRPEGVTFGGAVDGETVFGVEPGAVMLTDELLAEMPTLPPKLPRSAAHEMLGHFISSLDGQVVDAEGKLLTAEDGTPLKFGRLVWLGSAGEMIGGSLKPDPFPTRISPLLVYGLDALYSLIGFDGRTLAAQRFAAVQIQINASDLGWVFGQPPLSEGWARSLIERLKDSAAFNQNALGQLLEFALAEGRLHTVLLGAAVSEGVADPDSYTVSRLPPAGAGGLAGYAMA